MKLRGQLIFIFKIFAFKKLSFSFFKLYYILREKTIQTLLSAWELSTNFCRCTFEIIEYLFLKQPLL